MTERADINPDVAHFTKSRGPLPRSDPEHVEAGQLSATIRQWSPDGEASAFDRFMATLADRWAAPAGPPSAPLGT